MCKPMNPAQCVELSTTAWQLDSIGSFIPGDWSKHFTSLCLSDKSVEHRDINTEEHFALPYVQTLHGSYGAPYP